MVIRGLTSLAGSRGVLSPFEFVSASPILKRSATFPGAMSGVSVRPGAVECLRWPTKPRGTVGAVLVGIHVRRELAVHVHVGHGELRGYGRSTAGPVVGICCALGVRLWVAAFVLNRMRSWMLVCRRVIERGHVHGVVVVRHRVLRPIWHRGTLRTSSWHSVRLGLMLRLVLRLRRLLMVRLGLLLRLLMLRLLLGLHMMLLMRLWLVLVLPQDLLAMYRVRLVLNLMCRVLLVLLLLVECMVSERVTKALVSRGTNAGLRGSSVLRRGIRLGSDLLCLLHVRQEVHRGASSG